MVLLAFSLTLVQRRISQQVNVLLSKLDLNMCTKHLIIGRKRHADITVSTLHSCSV